MEIPPGGLVVRLMPVVDQQLPSSPPPTPAPSPPLTPDFKQITLVSPNMIEVDDGEIFHPRDFTKIYDSPSRESSYKFWESYRPGNTGTISDSNQKILLTKYVDVNQPSSGGRSSHKKYKKSSKRGRSMKRQSKKYSRRR
jgi:hypothetical protein